VALEGAGRGERPAVRSLYIHTPFCAHKCDYCDFYSFVDTQDLQAAFVRRLCAELEALAKHSAGAPLRTIFVGGGTPSLLRVELWRDLLACLSDHYDLGLIRKWQSGDEQEGVLRSWPEAEFTVECNPESASAELFDVLHGGGVGRVSMGAQSFLPKHLSTLQRLHRPERVAVALEAARAAGIARRSLDLIYAVPGQTLEEWAVDVSTALSLGTTHLSCYNLTYEPSTGMTNRLKRGEVTAVDEEVESLMFEHTGLVLERAGLKRYEVSNYAVPGHESRHNLAYWLGEQWLAAGPSASGHVWAGASAQGGGHRFKNVGGMSAYLAGGADGYSPIGDHEPPDPVRALRERVMTGPRLAVGVDVEGVLADAVLVRPACAARLEAAALELVGDGLLVEAVDGGRRLWRVTPGGWLMADFVAKRLMKAVGE